MAERGSFENPVPFSELSDEEQAAFERLLSPLDDPRTVVFATTDEAGFVFIEMLEPDSE